MFKGILKSVITVLTGYVSYVAKTVALMIGMGFVSWVHSVASVIEFYNCYELTQLLNKMGTSIDTELFYLVLVNLFHFLN